MFFNVLRNKIRMKEASSIASKLAMGRRRGLYFDIESFKTYIEKAKREGRDYKRYNEVLEMTETHFEEEMVKFDTKKVKNTKWRLFSKKHRKPGSDFYFWTVAIQIFLVLYTFLFFQNMEKTAKSILDSFSSNLFSGKMTLLLFLQIGFIVYERYLFLLNPRKWRDWEMFRFAKKGKTGSNEGEKLLLDLVVGIKDLKPVDKLKCVVKRLIIVRRLMGNISGAELAKKMNELQAKNSIKQKDEIVNEYIDNPLLKRYNYQIVIMTFVYFTTFVFLPISGNSKVSGSNFCNSIYKPRMNKMCNYTGENRYIWYFYVLYTFYFIVSALQIRKGESFMKN